jgi:hypothetical protein
MFLSTGQQIGTPCIQFLGLYFALYLTPSPSPACFNGQTREYFGWRGENNREGAFRPLSEHTPLLKQTKTWATKFTLFERRTKGESVSYQLNANCTGRLGLFLSGKTGIICPSLT